MKTITTLAELQALPNGAVIRDKFGDVAERRNGLWCSYETAALDDKRVSKYLPAEILWTEVGK